MRRCALIALIVFATVCAAPPAWAATPRPLWRAFPLGGQPLLQSPAQQQASRPNPERSHAPPPPRDAGQSVEESFSVTFLQVIVVTTLLAVLVVLTPVLVIRRRLD